jgi:hypothetical protein
MDGALSAANRVVLEDAAATVDIAAMVDMFERYLAERG